MRMEISLAIIVLIVIAAIVVQAKFTKTQKRLLGMV